MKLEIHQIECQRCAHKWVPRSTDVRMCPACKSVRFDQPRKSGTNQGRQDRNRPRQLRMKV